MTLRNILYKFKDESFTAESIDLALKQINSLIPEEIEVKEHYFGNTDNYWNNGWNSAIKQIKKNLGE